MSVPVSLHERKGGRENLKSPKSKNHWRPTNCPQLAQPLIVSGILPSGFGQAVANPSLIWSLAAGRGGWLGAVGSWLGVVGRSTLIFGLRIFHFLSPSLSVMQTHWYAHNPFP